MARKWTGKKRVSRTLGLYTNCFVDKQSQSQQQVADHNTSKQAAIAIGVIAIVSVAVNALLVLYIVKPTFLKRQGMLGLTWRVLLITVEAVRPVWRPASYNDDNMFFLYFT